MFVSILVNQRDCARVLFQRHNDFCFFWQIRAGAFNGLANGCVSPRFGIQPMLGGVGGRKQYFFKVMRNRHVAGAVVAVLHTLF